MNEAAADTSTWGSTMFMSASTGRRNDRQAKLATVEKDADRRWKLLPEKYQSDKEFVLTALRNSKFLPPKRDFERKFPQSLRFDRDVVMAFCRRDDFEELFKERLLFVPGHLKGDKEVMIAYCSKIRRSLQECTEELCDDADVVRAAIALDGLELQYASTRLQNDRDMVRAACENDGRALEFCPPGAVRTSLVSDRTFMLEVLRKHGGTMLRLASEPLRQDRELNIEALAHGLRFHFCPEAFGSDKAFLLEALGKKSEIFLELHPDMLSDRDVALAAIVSADSTYAVHSKALKNVPTLTRDRSVALTIAKRGDKSFLKEFLSNEEDGWRYRDDKEFMMAALERDCDLFVYASDRLHSDPEIIVAAIHPTTALTVLANINAEMQREHPEITAKLIKVTPVRSLRDLMRSIPEDLWQNRVVAIAWIRRGRPCRIIEPLLQLVQQDEEVALAVAQYKPYDFCLVGDAFKSNMDFMGRAVERDGRVLQFASEAIQKDLPLVTRAMANHPGALMRCRHVERSDLEPYIKSKLDLHQAFLRDFLRGIAVSPTPRLAPSQRSPLPMLDRGVETSQAFKMLIAEYLGVPTGPELKLMRKAWDNLSQRKTTSSWDLHPYLADHREAMRERRRDGFWGEARRDGGWGEARLIEIGFADNNRRPAEELRRERRRQLLDRDLQPRPMEAFGPPRAAGLERLRQARQERRVQLRNEFRRRLQGGADPVRPMENVAPVREVDREPLAAFEDFGPMMEAERRMVAERLMEVERRMHEREAHVVAEVHIHAMDVMQERADNMRERLMPDRAPVVAEAHVRPMEDMQERADNRRDVGFHFFPPPPA